jgi:hypothetical protein
VDVVTVETGYAVFVHGALDEVVPLHAILVGCPIGKVREARLTQLVLFQLPEVAEVPSLMEPDRPVVILALNGVRQRLSL